MVDTSGGPNQQYGPTIGLLYIFNLIVGTGALALPKAFQTAGYVLSVALLCISALVSYVSATFVVESLSVANAAQAKNKIREQVEDYDDVTVTEAGPSSFEITERIEVSAMASMFLGRAGVIFSYIALNVYLFGDLAIYSTTVPKSMMNLICSTINTSTVLSTDLCQPAFPDYLTRMNVYRICVVIFIVICTPMVLIGITKTKYIQLATTFSRWSAFGLMIILASFQLLSQGPSANPPAANVHGFGSLFGVTVYAFMCHHSLPSLVTPMSTKAGLFTRMMCIYVLVLAFYFTLSLTGSFAFPHVQDIYTLNFLHDDNNSIVYFLIDHFLALFPVFTLTTNYPIVAITLINNVKVLKQFMFPASSTSTSEEESLLDDDDQDAPARPRSRSIRTHTPNDYIITALVLALPTVISLLTDNVLFLAAVTGSYPGVGVQFIIPCLLVMRARTYARTVLNFPVPKRHSSPFTSPLWPAAIFAWATFAIIMVTLNMIHINF